MSGRRLIESPRIYSERLYLPDKLRKKGLKAPVSLLELVNLHSESEKQGGGRPEYWEMVFWWTRKPLAGARFVIAASLLPEDVDLSQLARALGLMEGRVAHRVIPNINLLGGHAEILRKASLLDSFAGFGSIPLEAARLGLSEVVAVELLPTAYVFLKAVLEYPSHYGGLKARIPRDEVEELEGILEPRELVRKGLARWISNGFEAPALIADLARAAKWVLDELSRDSDIKELYDEDVAVYIGTWEMRCPHCGRWTPLVGNWWLARVEKSNVGGYARIVYMKPVPRGDRVDIEVADLNKVHGALARAEVEGGKVKVGGETHTVPEPNIMLKGESATCLHDGRPLGYIDPETSKHYAAKNQAPQATRHRLEWLPKWALKQWNKMLEDYLNGKSTLDELREAPARPRLLVKVKVQDGDLEFHPATPQDDEKLWRALEKLRQLWGDPDIPTEPAPRYESRRYIYHYGFDKWFKLFNPRQLLTLVKLVKLIREAGKKVEEEKLREGWSKEEAYRYAEAVTTYLAIALVKQADYNSIVIAWNPATGFGSSLALLHAGHTLSFRGIAMAWNFVEYNPALERVGYNKFISMVVNGLSYLVSAVGGSSSSVRVVLGDATTLAGVDGVVDAVVTDPPYYDDVPYSELSDFYYVWLKRALSGVDNGRLAPRFVVEAFFRRVGGRWREVRTQWEEYALREISVNPGRLGWDRRSLDEAIRWFENRLGASLKAAASRLTPGGILVTYYNHTSVDAWASLLRAGWELAGLRVAAAVPLVTESGQRSTARGKVRLDTSIVVVWRRRDSGGVCDEREVLEAARREARLFVEQIVKAGRVGYDLLFAALGRALSVLTSCGSIVSPKGALSPRDVAQLAYRVATNAVAEALSGAAGLRVATPAGRFYLVSRILFAEAGEIKMDGSTVGIMQISTGVNVDEMVKLAILARSRRGQEASYTLLYPRETSLKGLRGLLEKRGLTLDPSKAPLRVSVDALHLLYYHAAAGSLGNASATVRERNAALYEEALSLARILCRHLPEGDPEKTLACSLARGAAGASLDSWL